MMVSTPSQDNRDIILDVTPLAENLAEVSNRKAKVFSFSLFISMVVLALKTTFAMTILNKVLLNKFVGHYLRKISTEISKSRRPKTRRDSLRDLKSRRESRWDFEISPRYQDIKILVAKKARRESSFGNLAKIPKCQHAGSSRSRYHKFVERNILLQTKQTH